MPDIFLRSLVSSPLALLAKYMAFEKQRSGPWMTDIRLSTFKVKPQQAGNFSTTSKS